LFTAILLLTYATAVFSQRNVTPAIERDPVLEQDAKHNLEVARTAFTIKKAYKGVLLRFEETYAAYPDFSKIDEFLYLAGMSSYYLSQGLGKQPVDLKSDRQKEKYAPAKLKEDAEAYLSTIVEKYPESQFRPDAEKGLALLKAGK
jgi:outer membrane protein assembly factor BamD (BamD/ComL family)